MPASPAAPTPARAGVEIPRGRFEIVPAELGDPQAIDRIAHRVIVTHWALAWLIHDGTPFGSGSRTGAPGADILPVIAEQGRKIRIVVEDDHARIAVWIAREDVADTVVAPLQLADSTGGALAIWLAPGVPLVATDRARGLREVAIVDDAIGATGWASAQAIGTVWVRATGDRSPTAMRPADVPTWSPPRDPRPLVRIDRAGVIRSAPDAKAPVLVSIKANELTVSVIAKGEAFSEVEAFRPFIRVRGFVDNARVLGPSEGVVPHGSASGHGFGMSHATRHEVAAGTCLFDRADGEVIGVTLETETRPGGQLDANRWAMVYIDTPWGVTSMYMKNLGTDAAQPVWDSCAEPAHRR